MTTENYTATITVDRSPIDVLPRLDPDGVLATASFPRRREPSMLYAEVPAPPTPAVIPSGGYH